MDAAQLLEAWGVHSRLLSFLLDNITSDALTGEPVGMKGRSVGEIFAHVHNNRLAWLEGLMPKLVEGVEKIPVKSKDDKAALNKEKLMARLESSSVAIANLLQTSAEKGKVPSYKRSPATFYSYIVAHEWYHVGEICMTLTQSGHRLPDEVLYGIWEWDKK
jgi:uncharacterized damage-inducible protein DinB